MTGSDVASVPMIIALDYDQTFTRDPKMWGVFLELAYAMGHEVFIVTMRESASSVESIEEKVADCTHSGVLYTNRRAKIDDLRDRRIEVDIWIDDNPSWILNDAADRPQTKAP